MKNNTFHNAFKLQGKSFNSIEELINFSKEISAEVSDFLRNWFDENSFVEVKTSGSTGNPKIIQLQKIHMIHSAKATGEYFNLPENTTAMLCMSTNYIAGKMMLVRALTLGWHLDIVEPTSNPLKNSDKIYDFSAMVPMQLHNSLADIHKIKKLIVGGGMVSNELLS
ncbi:MAG: O-succinylbenzoic acid--CoA ligase, partial [Lutibacter sp.]